MTDPTGAHLRVLAFATREELGKHAAAQAAATLRNILATRTGPARVMLAAAPSQQATLEALIDEPGIDWARVGCFHMDDYLGLDADAPQGFGNWLQRHFFDRVPAATFHRIDAQNDPESESLRYGDVMGTAPFDLVLLGLGVNGHLAFNDPPADFADPAPARVVVLDAVSRQQQVDEGHFASIREVPEQAITVTVPRLLNATELVASVPGAAKRQAVADTLGRPVTGAHPGTALRTHPRAFLFIDEESDPRPPASGSNQ